MTQTTKQPPPIDERKTKELCGSERGKMRCMRAKGHEHEHVTYTTDGTVTWDR